MTAEHARLAVVLRELRARTGLSLAALSERTAYSKSSWERYLNGKSLPPRQAVRELCRLANEPYGRVSALWEIAESGWSGRAAAPAPSEESRSQPEELPRPSEAGQPRGRRSRGGRLMVVLVSAYAVIVGGVALVFFLLSDREIPDDGGTPAGSAPYSLAPQCRGAACEGRDPMRLVCAIGPDTLTTYRTSTGANVELRYSEKCGATWARVWGARIGDRVEVTAAGPTRDVRIEDTVDMETYVYTEMTAVHPGSAVRACFKPVSADGGRECVEARVGGAAGGARRASRP
ncbi:hypothetical protein GCM10011583_24880 [Streptomyces camponoticapitis]|uniref:HTH cro/C1-type domain-containing protein n=1 Tax=Streptomyces camponoticapitis TaxID=1616125 RepID=A0ABQ2E3A8_9ACTN|nr:XRE family transcriptional regulator [Streptomyces camponoticapitis]GGJ92425.1 hypothetical protein GCM10011583_24880 [Streptomyces camponoticapitis]